MVSTRKGCSQRVSTPYLTSLHVRYYAFLNEAGREGLNILWMENHNLEL